MKHRPIILAACLGVLALVQACGGSNRDDASLRGPSEDQRASATILLDAGYAGSWPTGLDPATNLTARANLHQMNAIYGGLFQLVANDDGSDPRVVGVLAETYELRDEGKTLVIRLRPGVRFADGTPFDAEAVKFNIERNLASPCTCSPTAWPWVDEQKVTTAGPHTVELHFSRPYAPVMHAFPIANINWIASPTALQTLGEDEFRINPVGAGPFRIVSNQLSARLVLERNPMYFDEGLPYLDELVFQAIGSEQAGIQALLAGDAQAYVGLTSIPLIKTATRNASITVTQQPGTAPYVVQLNTSVSPFDDQRAREAIYYATDVQAILDGLFDGQLTVSEFFTGPGGLFYREHIEGYRRYDPNRAAALVSEINGLRVHLGTIQSFVAEQVATALATQWAEAGIEVTLETYQLSNMIDTFLSGDWVTMLTTSGSFDPEASGGASFRFRSDQPYTGVRDPALDQLLIDAAALLDETKRESLYLQAARLISDKAYAPFLFAFGPAQLTTDGLEGPGLTTRIPPILVNSGVLWQDVRFAVAR